MARGFPAGGHGTVSRGKMYTFVSGKKLVDSKRYVEFMYTFVYLPRKDRFSKIKGLAEEMSTFVYFCIPFMFGVNGFRLQSTG